MNSFRVDELMTMFDDVLRPFSDRLNNDTEVTKAHRLLKSVEVPTNSTFIAHMLVLDSRIQTALGSSPMSLRSAQESIIELAGLLERCEQKSFSSINEDSFDIGRQLLFKHCADYINCTADDTKAPFSIPVLSGVLHQMSYQAVSCCSIQDEEMAAWSASMSLASAATFMLLPDDELVDLLVSQNLVEDIVRAIVPEDGPLRRLHSSIFENGRQSCDAHIQLTQDAVDFLLDKMVLYLESAEVLRSLVVLTSAVRRRKGMLKLDRIVRELFGRLPSIPDAEDVATTSSIYISDVDVEIFVVMLSVWNEERLLANGCRVGQCFSSARVYVTMEQSRAWRKCVKASYQPETLKTDPSVLLYTGDVARSARLRSGEWHMRVLYGVFCYLEMSALPYKWMRAYSDAIEHALDMMMMYRAINTGTVLFPWKELGKRLTVSVNEEERIREHVSNFICAQLVQQMRWKAAERRLLPFRSVNSRRNLAQVYRAWARVAENDELSEVEEKLQAVLEYLDENDGDVLRALPITQTSIYKKEFQPLGESPQRISTVPNSCEHSFISRFPPVTITDDCVSKDIDYEEDCLSEGSGTKLPTVCDAKDTSIYVDGGVQTEASMTDVSWNAEQPTFADVASNTDNNHNLSVANSSFLSATSSARHEKSLNTTGNSSFQSARQSPWNPTHDEEIGEITPIQSPLDISFASPPEESFHPNTEDSQDFLIERHSLEEEDDSMLWDMLMKKTETSLRVFNDNRNKELMMERQNMMDKWSNEINYEQQIEELTQQLNALQEERARAANAALNRQLGSPQRNEKTSEAAVGVARVPIPTEPGNIPVTKAHSGSITMGSPRTNILSPLAQISNKQDGAKGSQQMVRGEKGCHPGETGFCLGCASDEVQDKALRTLDALLHQWIVSADD